MFRDNKSKQAAVDFIPTVDFTSSPIVNGFDVHYDNGLSTFQKNESLHDRPAIYENIHNGAGVVISENNIHNGAGVVISENNIHNGAGVVISENNIHNGAGVVISENNIHNGAGEVCENYSETGLKVLNENTNNSGASRVVYENNINSRTVYQNNVNNNNKSLYENNAFSEISRPNGFYENLIKETAYVNAGDAHIYSELRYPPETWHFNLWQIACWFMIIYKIPPSCFKKYCLFEFEV